jgi:hypothetical protein
MSASIEERISLATAKLAALEFLLHSAGSHKCVGAMPARAMEGLSEILLDIKETLDPLDHDLPYEIADWTPKEGGAR